jgi:short-subunit dehydrogenase
LTKPVCLIIGYGSGVGHGVATAFGNDGYDLILASRTPEKQSASINELQSQGVRVRSLAVDAGDSSMLGKVVADANSQSAIDVLVYNAIAPTFIKPTQLPAEQLVSDFRVNVVGALEAAQAVIPSMLARGSGCILFTGGGWAHHPWDQAASPSIGKAGLRTLALTLSQELSNTPVRIGLVSIMGQVAAGTPFDPEQIGKAFLQMVSRPSAGYETELFFTGT